MPLYGAPGEVLYAPTPEMGYVPGAVPETTLWDAETRRNHLLFIPAHGFTHEQHAELVDQVVAIGFPVNNFTSLNRKPNTAGKENYVGSWGIADHNYGAFSLYELIDKVVPEERLATVAHESTHANTPFDAHNAHLYGGEAERQQAAEYVLAVTDQSLVTKVHLDGYHKSLIEDYRAKKIDYATLAEETSAILAEMALTDRNGLRIVQERQQIKLEDENRINRLQGKPEHRFVPLLSHEGRAGAILAGVDRTLVKLLDGVNNHAQLVQHVHNLKAMLYRPENFATVQRREAYHTWVREEDFVPPAIAAYLHSLAQQNLSKFDDEDEDEKEK